MRLALLQLNLVVGDFAGNAGRIAIAAHQAKVAGAELCLTPELSLCGYPPRDLLLNPVVIQGCRESLEHLALALADGPPVLVGLPAQADGEVGKPVHNAVALLRAGQVERIFHKTLLPTYDVFDEDRYFAPGDGPGFFELTTAEGTRRIGVTICEDVWNDKDFWTRHRNYAEDPVAVLAEAGVDLLVNCSASPFTLGKQRVREEMLGSLARKYALPMAYCNQCGGNDDLLFDGRSFCVDRQGRVTARAQAFDEAVLLADTQAGGELSEELSEEAELWRALVTGIRDYAAKTGFARAHLGLSGGVDSALVAALAVQALGQENIVGLLLPSPHTSQASIDDAQAQAKLLGIRTQTLPIAEGMAALGASLSAGLAGLGHSSELSDLTAQNVQPRVRATLLMGLSNEMDSLLLATGNKSELAVGYCTIYGDMAGGLAPISDVPKTMVYRLCRWANATFGPVILQEIIEKAPSAELKPNQTDQDTLPAYDVLDAILQGLVEEYQSLEELVAAGHPREVVLAVIRMVKVAEFKRRQMPPGLKVTDRAFGSGWRMPIACRLPF